MSALARLVFTKQIVSPISRVQCTCIRLMSGNPYVGGNPPHLTGGQFKHPVGPPPSQEEISEWVRKESADQWSSLGWSQFDPKADRQMNGVAFFICVTLGLVLSSFMVMYSPRNCINDWYVREAYLLLREREAQGVEPISRDLIDPEKILAALPSDEELRENGVIINI